MCFRNYNMDRLDVGRAQPSCMRINLNRWYTSITAAISFTFAQEIGQLKTAEKMLDGSNSN